MSHTPHELAEEFPGQTDRLHMLKTGNAHFGNLADQYHEVNRTIHRAETLVEPMAEEHINALRRKRMTLKDEIARMLRSA
ncbi:MAG: DUF465 domain-containing protein [Pararhodobacter sp.]|nr:DUF465 domain-containing protein [Pararhodobacter sp.]